MKRSLVTQLGILFIVAILAICSESQTGTARAFQGQSTATPPSASQTGTVSPSLSLTDTVTSTAIPTSMSSPSRTPGPTQSSTPRPLIVTSTYQNLYPVGMAFNLTLNVARGNIQAIQIHIFQPITDINFTGNVDLDKHTGALNDVASVAGYLWKFDLSAGPAPIPFDPVYYNWVVTTRDGSVAAANYTATFQDTLNSPATDATIWRSDGDPPLRLYTHNQTLALDIVQSAAKMAYDKVRADTGIQRDLSVIIYDAGVDYCLRDQPTPSTVTEPPTIQPSQPYVYWQEFAERVPCDPAMGDLIYLTHRFVVIHRTSVLLDQLQDQVIGLIAGDAYAILWQNGSQPPAWFRGGLVQLYGISPRPYTLTLARDAIREGQLLPLTALNTFPNQQVGDETMRLWNAESYLLTLYVASRFGGSAPFKLAKTLDQNTTFDDALTTLGQVTVDTLYSDWQRWLLSDAADAALGWTPYLDTTSTPSPTSSPVPNQTQTISPVQAPTRTPLPTNTVIPLTPSNTPLPPGSLRTRTPTPVPSASNAGACPGSMALLLVPAGVVIANGRRNKRRIESDH